MRKILISVLLLVVGNYLMAQHYESLFGSNSTQWNITMGNLWGTGTDQHTAIGDTTINGNSYKVIDGYTVEGFQAYLREDTIQGKAWYKNNQDTTEFLIMDMQLSIGDSMFVGGNWNPQPSYYFVDSVYVLDNRKHIRFDLELFFISNAKFTLIEGISSNLGFRYQDIDYMDNFNPELLCSYKNGIQVFGTGECIYTGFSEIANQEKVNVYPNPFTDNVTIDLSQLKNKINQFDLISSTGAILVSGEVNNSKVTIENLDLFKNGIYLIALRDGDGRVVISKKVIKVTNIK